MDELLAMVARLRQSADASSTGTVTLTVDGAKRFCDGVEGLCAGVKAIRDGAERVRVDDRYGAVTSQNLMMVALKDLIEGTNEQAG